MNLAEAYKSIVTRPLRQRHDPLYVSSEDWVSIRDEVEAYQKERDLPVLSVQSDYVNFLLAGIEVRVSA